MRHPFDGIIIPETHLEVTGGEAERAATPAGPTRRSVLQWLLAGGAALWGLGGRQSALADSGKGDEAAKLINSHYLYLVVPKDRSKFTPERRKELQVEGDYFISGRRGNEDLAAAQGYMAWITPAQAEKLHGESDIKEVRNIGPDDVIVSGTPEEKKATLMVVPSPNNWRTKPDPSTYLKADALAKKWTKEFAEFKDVKVKLLDGVQQVHITFDPGPPPQKVLDALKSCPQVSHLQWDRRMTTMALGEEGAKPDRPRRTTKAIGEEGGVKPQPTTLAVGEEGAVKPQPRPPKMTTQALGEEGGERMTTMALGEEGGRDNPER
jgi:hypothetical protein